MEELRARLIEQTVMGDSLYVLANAVQERGVYLIQCRDWMRAFATLVNDLPFDARIDVLMELAWSPRKEFALYLQRGAIRKKLQRNSKEYSDGSKTPNGTSDPVKIMEEIRMAFLALETQRRDGIENYFRNFDIQNWELLLIYDDMLSECQKLLDVVVPRSEFRLQPLIPLNAPRGSEENAIPKIALPGAVEDRIPSIYYDEGQITLDSPIGMPMLQDVIKAGQTFSGRIHASQGDVSSNSATFYDFKAVNISIISIDTDRSFKGEIHILAGLEDKDQGTFPIEGSINNQALEFRALGKMPFVFKGVRFKGTTSKGSLSGVLLDPTLRPEGFFQFEVKK